jgi:hypothetical protein
MKSDYPFYATNVSAMNEEKDNELKAPSRFIDEKISDDSDAETRMDGALKPAGLNNPFWK